MAVILNEPEYREITKILTNRRLELGLTQTVVSKKLSINQSTLSRIETNESQIDILLLKRMAQLYSIKIEELI